MLHSKSLLTQPQRFFKMARNARDRRAHRQYSPEEIRRRAKAIKKNRPKKKRTKSDKVMIVLVIFVIIVIVAVSIAVGTK